jgi:signal peptidase I
MSFIHRIIFFGGAIFDLAKVLIVIVLLAILCHYFIGTVFIVSGESMVPTFLDGELVWSNKIDYLRGDPKYADNVVVLYPGDPTNKKYVKRIIGLPGDYLEIKEGKVYLNHSQSPLPEHYLPTSISSEPDGRWQIKENEYFLMGDNRPNSNDSRFFGPVERRFIFGKVTFIIWPSFQVPG